MANGNRKKSKKKLLIFGGLGLLIIILVIITLAGGSKENIILVQTEKVQKRSITQTVTATGTIDPEFKRLITPEVTGEIISLPVKEGDIVKKGQLLIKIKGDQYMAEKDRLEANLKSAEANLRMSEAELTRIELEYKRVVELHNKGLASNSNSKITKQISFQQKPATNHQKQMCFRVRLSYEKFLRYYTRQLFIHRWMELLLN